jgi:hypothetical protein
LRGTSFQSIGLWISHTRVSQTQLSALIVTASFTASFFLGELCERWTERGRSMADYKLYFDRQPSASNVAVTS